MNVLTVSFIVRNFGRKIIYRQTANFSIDQIGLDVAEKPFDYINKKYGWWYSNIHPVLYNIGDNTLCVSVDGNLGSCSTQIAKQLAAKIKFLHISLPDVDSMYFAKERYNFKKMYNDCVLPDRTLLNRNEWLMDCNASTTIRYYYFELLTRIHQYRMALMHMICTGQGVLFNSSYWSDSAFAKALYRHKLLSDIGYEACAELKEIYNYELKRPHLVIYIDKPVEDCLNTLADLQKSGVEPESTLLRDITFLQILREEQLRFLNEIEKYSYVLKYQYDEVKDSIDTIVEDMETLDFTTKCKDWQLTYTQELNDYLYELASDYHWKKLKRNSKKVELVPELTMLGEEALKALALMRNHSETRKKTGLDNSWKDQIILYYNLAFRRRRLMPFY